MDRLEAGQLETRHVQWPWVSREEFVTLTRGQWNYFDYLVQKYKTTPEKLHRVISEQFPDAKQIWGAVYVYIDQENERALASKYRLSNDNDPYHPQALRPRPRTQEERLWRRMNPELPPTLPVVKWSPFKPIARARRLFPEQTS